MKTALRAQIKQQRQALSLPDHSQLSQAVVNRLIETGFIDQVQSVHLYYPINNEVSTLGLIDTLWQRGICVVMPRTDMEKRRLHHFQVTGLEQLETGHFGLQEPSSHCTAHETDCDLILVPGVAFDRQLHRLGYGGGFYDRFLAKSQALKVALAFDFQIVDSVPREPHDIAMDHIVTESRVYP